MIPANHSAPVVAFFNFYAKWKMGRHFSEIKAEPPALDANRSLLVIGNHFSWWDGFLLLWVNVKFWRRKYHILMLEEELAPRKLFAKAGAFGIRKGSRDIVQTLRYASDILKAPGNVLVLFPQGRIESAYAEKLRFEKGVERMVAGAPETQVLFSVALPDYGTAQPKPALRFFFESFERHPFTIEEAERSYNDFLRRCREQLIHETEVRHAR